MEVVATATASHELVPQLRFPPGYRFVPTEEELVDVYLRAKIEGHKLPLDVVNDVNILDWQPGKLVEAYKGYGESRWFFFTVRHQSSSNKLKEPSRKVKVDGVTATWKATGSVQLIRRSRSKDGNRVVVGTKRVLIYNSSDPDENGKWSMHEYILKGHDEIGQYALYSIQRKQHSDTECHGDMDPEKKRAKKRKRTEKPCTEPEGVPKPCTEPEGVPLTHPETTTLLAGPPLKPARKAKAQRKKKSSLQVGVGGEQKQQQGQSPMGPETPPKKEELVPSSQQELQQQKAAMADGAPAPVVLSAVPLQAARACPPPGPDGTPGASARKPEEDGTLDDMSQVFALLYGCNYNQGQEQWPTDTTEFHAAPDTNVVVDHAQPYQQIEDSYSFFGVQNQHISFGENQSIYMEQGWQHADHQFFPSNTTPHLMNSSGGWEHGDDGQRHQIHHHHHQQQQQQQQENNGGSFGSVKAQQNHHPQGGSHDLTPSDEQSSPGSDESVQVDAFVRGVLHSDEPPQDLADGTQEQEGGDDLATLQAAGTQEQGADDTATLQLQSLQHDPLQLQSLQHDDLERQLVWLQLKRARSGHVWDAPCSCMICVAGLWHYFLGP